jgi:hypothetical protein
MPNNREYVAAAYVKKRSMEYTTTARKEEGANLPVVDEQTEAGGYECVFRKPKLDKQTANLLKEVANDILDAVGYTYKGRTIGGKLRDMSKD